MSDDATKVTPARLRRDAYLYIRQSTLYQVIHNTESTARQYDLKGRAVALGWPEDKIHVIDIDQGRSGASAADRAGFQQLVAEVSLGRAGIVLGLECSRLARDSADWQQLVKICAHADTLICDEDGLYDPAIFNDRVLLGMKGQLSEFELHFLRARMRGGILAKARRGELALALPVGLVRDGQGQVTLNPDAGVRDAVRLLFSTFTATGTAFGVVKAFREQQLTFPARHHRGPRRGELFFQPLTHDRVLTILHNLLPGAQDPHLGGVHDADEEPGISGGVVGKVPVHMGEVPDSRQIFGGDCCLRAGAGRERRGRLQPAGAMVSSRPRVSTLIRAHQQVCSSPWRRPRTSAAAARCSSAAPSSSVRAQASSSSWPDARTARMPVTRNCTTDRRAPRIQPRTVPAGTARPAAMGRCPCPRAARPGPARSGGRRRRGAAAARRPAPRGWRRSRCTARGPGGWSAACRRCRGRCARGRAPTAAAAGRSPGSPASGGPA